nr:hypothetical protein GCM10020241_35990 [Streptoalloteichus tenebrarius]
MAEEQSRANGTAEVNAVRQCRAGARTPTRRTAGGGTRPSISGHTHVDTAVRSVTGPTPPAQPLGVPVGQELGHRHHPPAQ